LEQEIMFPFQAPGWTKFTAVKNDLKVEIVPSLLREEPLCITLGLFDVFAVRQAPTVHQSMDVGVHGKRGNTE
jgi:hypothetical protein